jgi:HEAT repeat protein
MEPPATSSRSSTTTTSTTTTTTTMTSTVRNLILPRLTDKAQAVRFAALQACATIANDDPIITEPILWNLHHDPSWANRCASLHSLPVHEHTVDHIIRRMRDVKTKVRLAAVAALHQISMLDLTADQCAIMVRTGLTDR